MINLNIDTSALLKQLGDRLKEARLSRNESQDLFAQRLGITRQSYSKMEKGSPNTPIGNWLTASAILAGLEDGKMCLPPRKTCLSNLREFEKKAEVRWKAEREKMIIKLDVWLESPTREILKAGELVVKEPDTRGHCKGNFATSRSTWSPRKLFPWIH